MCMHALSFGTFICLFLQNKKFSLKVIMSVIPYLKRFNYITFVIVLKPNGFNTYSYDLTKNN